MEEVTPTPVTDPVAEPDPAPAGDVTDDAPETAAQDIKAAQDADVEAADETKPAGVGRHRADADKDETGSEPKATEPKTSEPKAEQKDSEPKAAA